MKRYMNRWMMVATGVLCSLLSFQAYAQNTEGVQSTKDANTILIEGVVYNEATDEPIFGATVRMGVKAVFTNEQGVFKIKTNAPKNVMEVTAPGYDRRDIEWRGRTNLKIALSSEQFSASFGSRPMVSLENNLLTQQGVAYNTIEDLGFLTPQQTPDLVIQSHLGNLRTISRSGKEGIGSAMYIRGINSLNTSSQPLILVDGVIMDTYLDITSLHDGFFANPLSHIDLKDVESITVIKDAASLYGAKAANGVIMIETKRGHSMATQIVANMALGSTMKPNTIPVLDAGQSRILMSEIYKGSMLESSDLDDMPVFNDDPDGLYYAQNHNTTDWKDWVYQNGINQTYSMRATGGDAVGMYSLSVGYTNNKGVVQNTGMSHLNSRFNSDININKQVKMAIDFSISSLDYDLMNDGMTSLTSPTAIAELKSPLFYPYSYSRLDGSVTTNIQDYDVFGVNNPLSIIQMSQLSSKQTNFVASAKPVWTINKNWRLSALAGYGINKLYESYFTPMTGVAPSFHIVEGGYIETHLNEAKGQSMKDITTTMEGRLSYAKELDLGKLSAAAGFRYQGTQRRLTRVNGYNTGEDNLVYVSNALKYKHLEGEDRTVKNLSWFAQANLNRDDKYFLSATASMESSSRFGQEIKAGSIRFAGVHWGMFPSVSGAWLLSAEDFMSDVEAVDMLKLRASYGITGNDEIQDYVSNAYFSSQNFVSGAVGLVLSNLGNPTLKWETTRKANAGVDVSFLNNRLSFTGDVFQHHTSDLLVLKKLESPLSGFNTYWSNDGEISNKGYEVSVNARLINTKKIRWEVTASAAHYKNEVLALADGDYTTSVYDGELLTSVGNPIALFYGYKYEGVYSTKEAAETAHTNADGSKSPLYQLNNNTSLTAFQAGDAIFDDLDNNGRIDKNDKQIIGNPNPDLTGILSSTISYKGLSLTGLFTYSYGNDMYNYQRQVLESMSGYNNQSVAVLNRWRSDGQVTNIPRALYGDPIGNARFSSRWVEDASYLRLKSLSLAWTLPYKMASLQGVTVWASANNLWILTPYLGTDPETSISNNPMYQGIDTGALPQSTSYTVGVRLNL